MQSNFGKIKIWNMSDKIDRVATAGTLGAHASQGATMTSLNTNESTNKGENEGKQSTLSYSKNMKSFDKSVVSL